MSLTNLFAPQLSFWLNTLGALLDRNTLGDDLAQLAL